MLMAFLRTLGVNGSSALGPGESTRDPRTGAKPPKNFFFQEKNSAGEWQREEKRKEPRVVQFYAPGPGYRYGTNKLADTKKYTQYYLSGAKYNVPPEYRVEWM